MDTDLMWSMLPLTAQMWSMQLMKHPGALKVAGAADELVCKKVTDLWCSLGLPPSAHSGFPRLYSGLAPVVVDTCCLCSQHHKKAVHRQPSPTYPSWHTVGRPTMLKRSKGLGISEKPSCQLGLALTGTAATAWLPSN